MDRLRSLDLGTLQQTPHRGAAPLLPRSSGPAAPVLPGDQVSLTVSQPLIEPPAPAGSTALAPIQQPPTTALVPTHREIEGFFVAESPSPQESAGASLMGGDDWMVASPLVCSLPSEAGYAYPGRRPVPPGAVRGSVAQTAEWERGARLAQHDVCCDRGVWSAELLNENRDLAGRLQDFLIGRTAQSVRHLQVEGKKPEELHGELMAAGFVHQREPLKAGLDPTTGQSLYTRRDGSRGADPYDSENVPHDIYVHPDGGVVRVKPEGVPGNKFRPEPHVSKSVLIKSEGPTFTPADAVDFDNEAFKVTSDGIPVPKAATQACGLKPLPAEQPADVSRGYMDTVMTMAHSNIPLDMLAT